MYFRQFKRKIPRKRSRRVIDDLLVRQAQAGSQEAFKALISSVYAKAYSRCLSILRNEADAEDAMQDTLIAAWRYLPTFRGTSAFSTWFYAVTVTRALMLRREIQKKERLIEHLERCPHPEFTPKSLDYIWMIPAMKKAAANYDSVSMDILAERIYGLSSIEIAEPRGITEPAAKSRMHRAREKMKVALGKWAA